MDTDTANIVTYDVNEETEGSNQRITNESSVDSESLRNSELGLQKPILSKSWPLLLTVAFLSCFTLLFISEMEWKIISGSVSLAVIVLALSKILEHEKMMTLWKEAFLESLPPEESVPVEKLKKKNIRRRTVSIKKK